MRRIIYYIIKNEIEKEELRTRMDTMDGIMKITIITMAVIFIYLLFSSN